MREYNEHEILKRYILTYYSSLFTPLERLGFKAIRTEEKAKHASPKMATILRNRYGAQNNPEVVAALQYGTEAFKEAVFHRIMTEHPHDVFMNRCPKCHKIVRTPQAKQCPWCFYNWHQKP